MLRTPKDVIAALITTLALCITSVGWADSLPEPTGKILLVIKGDMLNTNIKDEAHFDLAMLKSLERTEFTTSTPWDDGMQTFAGAKVIDILKLIGAPTLNFNAIGVDDYSFDVTDIEFDRYPIIIAYEHNGEPISVRKLGPLRLMFPVSDFPELGTQKNEASAVWQLVEMRLL